MTLTLTAHRGTSQIDGTCIEIGHRSGARLMLDAGRQLDAPRDARNLLPTTLDLTRPATVLICQAHPLSLLHELPSSWPVMTGPISKRPIRTGHAMNKQSIDHTIAAWSYRSPFQVGPFTATA